MLNNATILQDRYKIVKILGRGGMGAVYLAEDQRLPTQWAIKEMKREGLSDEEQAEAVELFRSEARLLSELRHRNLPRIVDFFEQDTQLYLVMDFVDGGTLEDRIEKQGPISVNFALEFCLQVADVLDYLHTRSDPVVFRDFKPGNVMLTPNDEVKLIDFGIARVFKKEASSDTRALGTPGYAAPEQYGQGQSGPRTDLYAFGATVHHALTGRDPTVEPFNFPPITDFRQDLPTEFVDLIERCLNLRANDRPESAFAVKRALEPLLRGVGSSALTAGRPSTTVLSGSAAPVVSTANIESAKRQGEPEASAQAAPPVKGTEPIDTPVVTATATATATAPQKAAVSTTPSTPAAPTIIFRPNEFNIKELPKGEKKTVRVRVKSDRAITLSPNSEHLQVHPNSLTPGTTSITMVLNSDELNEGDLFMGALEVGGVEGVNLPIQARIVGPRASAAKVMWLYVLCLFTLLPFLNYFTTLIAGFMFFSTDRQQRSSLKIPWYLTLFFTFGWTMGFLMLGLGLSLIDWTSLFSFIPI